MENPLKAQRLNQGLTIDQLASRAKVTRNLIIRAEQGCYTNPPPSLISVLFRTPAQRANATTAYKEFQSLTRKANSDLLSAAIPYPPVGIHPLQYWFTESGIPNLMRFCILFCVQQSIAYKFIHNPRKVVKIPASITQALKDAGVTDEQLVVLELFYRNFRALPINSEAA